MTEEEKKAIESIKRKITIGKCEKNIGIPVYISELEILLNLIQKQDTEINKLNNAIQNIREEFLKYDWENSTKEQIYNQLKSLYESIFMKEDK